MKKLYGVSDAKDIPDKEQFKLMEVEQQIRNQYNAPVGELVYLGLASTYFQDAGGWGGSGGMTWTLTDFAYEFMKYIEGDEGDRMLLERADK
ncbi:hypothetical protein H0V99_01420 [Candidatus Saccharibacteria bacterium]|nr:hypothetical protein [Candidatus Saccharibacteria bacterium]